VLDGLRHLEHRVLLSTISRSTLPAPAAEVARLRHLSTTTVDVGEKKARPAARVASDLLRGPTGAAIVPTARRWSWLANTYWYVPASNLAAVLYDSATGTVSSVSDQTVYHINDYRGGYFWGDSVTQLGSNSPSSSFMVGSVTPERKVLLTFTQTSTNSSPSITNGYGVMQRKFGQWTMENQMFTAPTEKLQIGHWAYMLQTRPGMPSWYSLPSAGVSVPEFLSE
jgi:hypothetical protein